MVKTYSKKTQDGKHLAPNFTVAEFACHDGSDTVKVDSELVDILQQIRDHFRAPVTINSAYRTAAYNKQIGGVTGSQHTLGTAADISVAGVSPVEVAAYAEYLMPRSGGIGLYDDDISGHFVHVDVRQGRSRWHQIKGVENAVAGFQAYRPAVWYEQAQEWCVGRGITDGTRPNDGATRAQVWVMIWKLWQFIRKWMEEG